MADKKEKKKSHKDERRAIRMLEKEMSGGRSLIDYNKINQRHMDDKRFERELKNKNILQDQADHGTKKGAEQAPSATYDAFMRMQTGQETRTIADKINDPNRVSWEKFRKDNADKLDIPGADRKKMIEYRAQLDAEREAALAKGRNRPKRKLGVSSSSESEGEDEGKGAGGDNSEDGGSSSKRKKKKKEKRSKKDKDRDREREREGKGGSRKKKHGKSKKSSRRRKDGGDDSGGSTDSDGGSGAEEERKDRRKDKKSKKKSSKESDPRRLSDYLKESSASES